MDNLRELYRGGRRAAQAAQASRQSGLAELMMDVDKRARSDRDILALYGAGLSPEVSTGRGAADDTRNALAVTVGAFPASFGNTDLDRPYVDRSTWSMRDPTMPHDEILQHEMGHVSGVLASNRETADIASRMFGQALPAAQNVDHVILYALDYDRGDDFWKADRRRRLSLMLGRNVSGEEIEQAADTYRQMFDNPRMNRILQRRASEDRSARARERFRHLETRRGRNVE